MTRVPPAVGILFTLIVAYVLWSSYAASAIGDAAGGELIRAIVALILLYLVATHADEARGFVSSIPQALETLFRPDTLTPAGGPAGHR